ncbi:MAG: CBS domain-containing protein [Thermodesulfovibrionales bacterium]
MLKARDIMREDVLTVSPNTTVEEIGRLFIEKGVSGAPVVDEEGMLLGIVTENDLIAQNSKFHIPTILRIFDAFIPLESSTKMEREIRRMAATTAGEICTRDVVTIDEETSLTEIATIMSERKIHLLPVMRGKRIVGIVGKREIIRGASHSRREQ